jgi:hypothetical protein
MSETNNQQPPIEPSIEPWRVSRHELVVTPGMHRVSAARVGAVLALAVLVLAMLASEPLVNWANRLPAHPIAETIIAGTQAWHRAMQAIGMTDVFSALKAFSAALRAL